MCVNRVLDVMDGCIEWTVEGENRATISHPLTSTHIRVGAVPRRAGSTSVPRPDQDVKVCQSSNVSRRERGMVLKERRIIYHRPVLRAATVGGEASAPSTFPSVVPTASFFFFLVSYMKGIVVYRQRAADGEVNKLRGRTPTLHVRGKEDAPGRSCDDKLAP